MSGEERRARIVDVHYVEPEDGRRPFYMRNKTRSEDAPIADHVARAKEIDKAGKRGANDLPGRHVGVVIEERKHSATIGADVVSHNPASGIALMIMEETLDNGEEIKFAGIDVKLTRDDLPTSFHRS